MIRVEVSGAGPCSGLLLLPPKTAARWQAVRRRLACHQLVILAETLLQLAEKHCREEAPAEEPPSTYQSTTSFSTKESRNEDYSVSDPSESARGLPNQPDHNEPSHSGTICDLRTAERHQRSEVTWGHDLTSGQLSGVGHQLEGRLALDYETEVGPAREDTRPSPIFETLNGDAGTRWQDTNSSHVMSHVEVGRSHVTSHTAAPLDYTAGQSEMSRESMLEQPVVPRDQQVSVILSADSVDRAINHAINDEQLIQEGLHDTQVLNQPEDLIRTEDSLAYGYRPANERDEPGNKLQSAGGVDSSPDRRSRLRPPGSNRPCVLRRGRAICSTDGTIDIDGTVSSVIDGATKQTGGYGGNSSSGPNLHASEERSSESYSPTTYQPGRREELNVSQNAASEQDHVSSNAADMTTQSTAHMAAQAEPASTKMSPPSHCTDCDAEHSPIACPLQHPRCWAQDSSGGCGAETLPACLRIDGGTVRAGPDGVAAYTLFGPLAGRPVRPEHLVEPVDLRHIWEVYGEGAFLDTSDPATSSWFRMLRPAARRSQRTLAVVTRQRHLFAVSTCHLAVGTELTYWQDDPGTAWSGKNMLKTRCGGCNMKFEHPLYYRRHCSLFHEPGTPLTVRKYYCKVCGEAVMGRQKLLRHALEKHDGAGAYQCQHCGKFFRRLSYLELHRNHGCSANPERTHPLCHLCGARFSQPQKLRAHIRREHSELDPSVSECRCPRCGRLLGCRTALRRHLREVHPPPERASEAALRCNRCGKQFRNQCNLKVHMLTHSGVKPFRCSIAGCESAFTTKQCLQQHYGRVHQLRGGAVPPITRSVPYTVRGYSGQLPDPPPTTRRRLLCRGDRLRFSDFSVSRDLPEPSSGPRLMQDASRSELDCIEPSLILGGHGTGTGGGGRGDSREGAAD